MNKEGRRWKGLTFLLVVVLLVATIFLPGAVTAVQAAEVSEVRRYAPAGPPPGEEFEVTLRITGELPLVVGIVETIPAGFEFVSTTHPAGNYSVSGEKVAFAVINTTEIKYKVKAPSSGEGTFKGRWVDMLSEKEGTIADTIVIVGGGGAGAVEAPTVTPTPTPFVPVVLKAERSVPVMEAGKEVAMVFKDMHISMVKLRADRNVTDVKARVERIDKPPEVLAPTGITYVYIEIEVEETKGAKIEGKVEFKVARSWIAANNIDEATIRLNRYDKEWKALPTYKVGEEDATIYFEAETPEFSLFAITGEKKVEVAAPVTPTPTLAVTPTPVATPTPSPTPPTKVPGFEAIIAAVSLLIAGLFVVRKRRR